LLVHGGQIERFFRERLQRSVDPIAPNAMDAAIGMVEAEVG
jgi:hypothetical protein